MIPDAIHKVNYHFWKKKHEHKAGFGLITMQLEKEKKKTKTVINSELCNQKAEHATLTIYSLGPEK